MAEKKQKLIIPTALNVVVEVNEVLVSNWKKGEEPQIRLPNLIDRAFLVHHENGLLPITEYAVED